MTARRLTAAGPDEVQPRIASASWIPFALFALGALCYANTVRGEFVFDDIKLIVNNDIVKDPKHVSEIFFTNLWGLLGRGSNYYRPLPPLVFMLLHALFGMRPEPFHLVNIALHAGATSLVFLTTRALLVAADVSRRRALWPACAGAALFAVHPIHTEAVAWISGVMDVSCTFFSLLAIHLYITGDDHDRRTPREALSLGALLLALLSKEPAAVVPFALVAYDLLFCRQRIENTAVALRRWAPPFAVLMGYLCLRGIALGGIAPFRHEESGTTMEVLLTLPQLFALYIQKLVLPVALNVVHDLEPVTAPTSPEFLLALIIIAAFGGLSWVAVRAGRVATYGVLLFVMALAPSLYLPALSQDLSKAFAERYLYFPSAGAALLVAAGLVALRNRSRRLHDAALATLGVVIVVFSGMTVSRNTVWKNSLTLWSDCVQKSPNLGLAHESLGLALIRRGQVREGTRELQVALRLEPELAQSSLESGVRAAQKGLLLQAILSFQTALLYKPEFVEAHYNLAIAFERLGWKIAAIQEYQATLRHKADHVNAHNNLGILFAEQARLDEAIDHFEAAVRSRPGDADLHLNLARAYEIKGRASEAARQRALAALAGVNLAR